MVEIVDLALRAVIDYSEIYTINSLIKNKNFETNSIQSFQSISPKTIQSFTWGSATKTKQKYYYYYCYY